MTNAEQIDQYIGARLRQARKQKDMSQQALGEALGVSFQQIQKYERGSNRISCSTLVVICRALDLPPSFFLPQDLAQEDIADAVTVTSILNDMPILAQAAKLNPQHRTIVSDVIRGFASAEA